MKVQITDINKAYHDYDESKLMILLKIDADLITSGSTELQEIYEDAVSIAEDYIHKDIAYTLKEYKFFDFCNDTVILDEGNYISISAITYTDSNNIQHSVSGYTVRNDNNKIIIDLPYSICVQDAENLTVLFCTGYEKNKMHKSARRVIYILCADLYDWERSSYSVQQSQNNKAIERYLNPLRKDWHVNYNKI